MRTDEELIAERNIQIVASALLEVMNIYLQPTMAYTMNMRLLQFY